MLSVMLSNGNVVGFGRPALLSAKTRDGDSSQEGDDAGFLEGHESADCLLAIVGGHCSFGNLLCQRQLLTPVNLSAGRAVTEEVGCGSAGGRARPRSRLERRRDLGVGLDGG